MERGGKKRESEISGREMKCDKVKRKRAKSPFAHSASSRDLSETFHLNTRWGQYSEKKVNLAVQWERVYRAKC